MLKIFKQYYPIRNIFFVIGEFLFIFLAVVLAEMILVDYREAAFDISTYSKTLLIACVCQAFLYYNDLYDFQVTATFGELGIRLFQAIGASSIFLAGVYIIFPDAIIGHGIFGLSVVFIILFIVAWRLLYAFIIKKGLFNEKIMLIGSGEQAKKILSEVEERKDCGYMVSLIIVESQGDAGTIDEIRTGKTYKTDYHGMSETAEKYGIKKIVVALKEKRGAFPLKELLKCRTDGIQVIDGNSFYEMLTGKLIVEQINPAWLIFSEGFHKSAVRRFFKRSVDLLLSVILLALLSPLILLVAVSIKLDSKGPVIFSQQRVGKKRKTYMIYKFRSMVEDAEKHSGPVWAQTDDARITRVGKIIRKLRLDEIPQLWNVLKGNMSFVGPRPERGHFVKTLEELIPYYGERFTVKPGITGWAQVSYGYGASVEDAVEKLNYDLFYIKNMSIFMDIMIVFKTVKTVLFGKGAR